MDELSWQRSLPRKWMAAGAVIRDHEGRVLMVEPTYKEAWEIPGGVVELDESPRAACARELREELGLALEPGRLLCLEWQHAEADRTESLMFLYDGGVLPPEAVLRLPEHELSSYRFVPVEELSSATVPCSRASNAARTRRARRSTVTEDSSSTGTKRYDDSSCSGSRRTASGGRTPPS